MLGRIKEYKTQSFIKKLHKLTSNYCHSQTGEGFKAQNFAALHLAFIVVSSLQVLVAKSHIPFIVLHLLISACSSPL